MALRGRFGGGVLAGLRKRDAPYVDPLDRAMSRAVSGIGSGTVIDGDDGNSGPPKRTVKKPSGLFDLSAPVGPNARNKPKDVARVDAALGGTGHKAPPKSGAGPSRAFTAPLERIIKRFQKNRGLKPDGLLNPKGPTIRKLAGEGGFAGKARALQTALPKLSGEAYAANGRTVKTLLKRSGYGDMPTYMSDAWGGDDKGKAEVTDLLGQLEDAAPKAAGALRNQLAQKLVPAERGLLFAAAAIRRLAEDDEKPEDKPEKKPEKEPDKPDPEKARRCQAVTGTIKAEKNRLNDRQEELLKAKEAVSEAEENLRKSEQEFSFTRAKVSASLSAAGFSAAAVRGLGGLLAATISAGLDVAELKKKYTAMNMAENELGRVMGDVEWLNGVIEEIESILEDLKSEQEEVCDEKDDDQSKPKTNYNLGTGG